MPGKSLLRLYASLFLVSLIWGLNFGIMRLGVLALGPLAFPFLRFLLSTPLFFLVLWRTEGSVGIALQDVPLFFLLGTIGFGLYQPLWSFGLRLSLASHSALLLSLTPVIVAIMVLLRGEEGFRGMNFAGILLGFLGIVILAAFQGQEQGGQAVLLGDLLTLGAALLWGLYCYFGKLLLRKYSPLKSSAWSMLFGVLTMFPVCARDVFRVALCGHLTPVLLFVFLYGTVLSSLVAYMLWMRGIEQLGASRTTAFQYVTQIFGVVGAWLIFRDPLSLRLFVSMVLIGLGLLLTQWRAPLQKV